MCTRHAAIVLLMLIGLSGTSAVAQIIPTAPTPRPRLLLSAAEIPMLQARLNGGGQPAAAWGRMRTSASWACGTTSGACGGGTQAHWRVDRACRYMQEMAFQYAVTGNTTLGQRAKTMLIAGGSNSAVGYLLPAGRPASDRKAYREGALASAVAVTFDLIYPLLSSSERATVVRHLEGWIDSFRTQSNAVGSYVSYGAATDNHSFAWNCGIAFALMAIWGDSNRPNIGNDIDVVLRKLQSGHNDTFSPEGSYDESHGYINYGGAYSVRALIAGRRMGFSDYLAGSNVLHAPRWYLALNSSGTFPLSGDTSSRHREQKWDPIMYALVTETGDEEAFWGIEQIAQIRPVSEDSDSMAFSPFISTFLYYPDHLTPRAPRVRSAFFRDNLNLAPGGNTYWNKLNNHDAVGLGGTAHLHSEVGSGPRLSLNFTIRDEWMSHTHEDDGHLGLILDGEPLFMDIGLATNSTSPAFFGGQSLQHNIVSANRAEFLGSRTNHFSPPPPEGRFHGERLASLLGGGADFVRSQHRFMWMMDEANRTVLLIKDATRPLALVYDRVRLGSGSSSYEQRWHTPVPMSGSGRANDPYEVSRNGRRVRGVMLSPTSFNRVSSGGQTNPATNLTYYRNEIVTTGTGPVDFVGVWSPANPLSQAPLSGPVGDTRGGTIDYGGGEVDKVMVSGTGGLNDTDTISDGRLAWIRRQNNQTVGYALGEGTMLRDRTIDLVDASEVVSVAVHNGHVDIARDLSLVGSPFTGTIALHIPFNVVSVSLDGEPFTNFTITGSTLSIGTPAPRPLPGGRPPFTLDRHYRFDPAVSEDGVMSGDLFVNSLEQLATRNGATGLFRPLDGTETYNATSLWVAFDTETGTGFGGQLGAVHLEDPNGSRLMTVSVWDNPNVGRAIYVSGPMMPSPLLATIPAVGSEPNVRVGLLIHLRDGILIAHDRSCSMTVTGSFTSITSPVIPIVEVNGDARWDNISILDDAERAQTPQGIVAWLDGNGRLGFYSGAPNVLALQDLELDIGGTRFDVNSVMQVMLMFGFREELLVNYLPPGALGLPLREMSWNSSVALPSGVPGMRHVFDLITLSSDRLVDGAIR